MERERGIEPPTVPWQGTILPLNYSRFLCRSAESNCDLMFFRHPCTPRTPPRLWWTQRDSNPRPCACHTHALPTELWAQNLIFVPLVRLERTTHSLGVCCSIHLSYRGECFILTKNFLVININFC